MRYTKWDPELGRWVVQCLHKPEGGQITFFVFEEPGEVIENNKGQKMRSPTSPVPKVYGEAIDRLAELEDQKEQDQKTIGEYEDRLRHLLRSKTIQLFDEWDPQKKDYKRDIRRLDTYGIDKKVLEHDRTRERLKRQIDGGRQTCVLQEPKVELAPFRPCEIDGTPAFFHRWVEEDRVLLHVRNFAPDQHLRARLDEFKRDGLVYPDCHTEAVRHTFALVEYADGTVGKVDPEMVKFTDRRAQE